MPLCRDENEMHFVSSLQTGIFLLRCYVTCILVVLLPTTKYQVLTQVNTQFQITKNEESSKPAASLGHAKLREWLSMDVNWCCSAGVAASKSCPSVIGFKKVHPEPFPPARGRVCFEARRSIRQGWFR